VADAGRVVQEGQAQQHLPCELCQVGLRHNTNLQELRRRQRRRRRGEWAMFVAVVSSCADNTRHGLSNQLR
jgi:hypothetical protein